MVKKFPSSRLARADFIFKSVMFTLFDRMKICFILYVREREREREREQERERGRERERERERKKERVLI